MTSKTNREYHRESLHNKSTSISTSTLANAVNTEYYGRDAQIVISTDLDQLSYTEYTRLLDSMLSICSTINFSTNQNHRKEAKKAFKELTEASINFEEIRLHAVKYEYALIAEIDRETKIASSLTTSADTAKLQDIKSRIETYMSQLNIIRSCYKLLENSPMSPMFELSKEVAKLTKEKETLDPSSRQFKLLDKNIKVKTEKVDSLMQDFDLTTVEHALLDRQKIAEIKTRIKRIQENREYNEVVDIAELCETIENDDAIHHNLLIAKINQADINTL